MNIYDVSFTRRKNKGNYEHDEVTLKAQISEEESYLEVIAKVKYACDQALGMIVSPTPKVEEVEKVSPVKKASKKVTKKVNKKKAVKKNMVEEIPVIEPITLKSLKVKLIELAKARGLPIAKDVLSSFDVSKSDELTEEQFPAVMREIEKCLN